MTHSSLWADLSMIKMDGIVDFRFGSEELDFVNSTSNPVVSKPGQIMASTSTCNFPGLNIVSSKATV